VRILAVLATVFISFIYVVAQIYGVGLITSRFTGVDFSVGIFLGWPAYWFVHFWAVCVPSHGRRCRNTSSS
jgi:Na+(H+)/acetate symporter ActP